MLKPVSPRNVLANDLDDDLFDDTCQPCDGNPLGPMFDPADPEGES